MRAMGPAPLALCAVMFVATLGLAYENDGELQLAVAQYRKVLSIQPDHQRALQHLHALSPQQAPTRVNY